MNRAVDDGESGSIQVLLLGFVALALSVILAVTAATSLYLEHARLFALADATALAAAENFDLAQVAVDGDHLAVRLDSERVRTAGTEYLAESGAAARFESLTMVEAQSPDGRSAVVSLRATWRPPLVIPILPISVPVTVVSHARVVLE